ncbi:MAG: MlaD family protein [Planctomycetota bacterium]
MSKSAYFRIGVFVIAAVLVGSAGLIMLGSGAFKEKGIIVETYLDEAVSGLSKGSPVKYRGVEVGAVESVGFAYQTYGEGSSGESFTESGRFVVVRMTISRAAFTDQNRIARDPREVVEKEIKRGLRVRLATQGISPVAYMEFDYFADKKAGPDPDAPADPPPGEIKPLWIPEHIYIPSVPSTANRLTMQAESVVNSLADAKIDVVARDVDLAILEVTRLIKEDLTPALKNVNAAIADLGPTFRNVGTASEELAPLLKNVRQISDDLAPVAKDLKDASSRLPATVDSVNEVAMNADVTIAKIGTRVDELTAQPTKLLDSLQLVVDRDLGPTLTNINRTAEDLPEALASLQMTFKRVDRLIALEQDDLNDVLSNIRAVSQDVQELGGYAKKYPAHILFGNPPPPRERK